MNVFFYGLFMDKTILAAQGIRAASAEVATLDGYALRIGERATLERQDCGCVYGVVMNITPDEAAALYAEESVADYVPEAVSLTMPDQTAREAQCYILPASKTRGTNAEYGASLRAVASSLGFPAAYISSIQ